MSTTSGHDSALLSPHDVEPAVYVSDVVRALVDSHTTTERVDAASAQVYRTRDGGLACRLPTRRVHYVEHGSLLQQLAETMHGGKSASREGVITGPTRKGKAPGREDALLVTQRIDREALWWAQALRTRTRVPLPDRLRGLVGAADRAGDELVDSRGRTLVRAAASWLSSARILTGHERAPFSPAVRCPEEHCERLGGLRVRLDTRTAACVECGAYWNEDGLDRLALWIRWAAQHLAGPWHLVPDDAPVGVAARPCPGCHVERAGYASRQAARRAEEGTA